MNKQCHAAWQGEGQHHGDVLFQQVLMGFVNERGLFPRSILNKYCVINFKQCLGRRRTSVWLKTARGQIGVNYFARKVKTWLPSVSAFLPWVYFSTCGSLSPFHSLHYYQKLHNNLQEIVSPAPAILCLPLLLPVKYKSYLSGCLIRSI